MKYIEELVENLSETLLWECISDYVENLSQAETIMGIISKSEANQGKVEVVDCSIIDSDEFSVENIKVVGEDILISFEMSFVLLVNMEIRIEAVAVGTCRIPDVSSFNYNQYDFDSMNKAELLKYKDIVSNIKISYEDVELLGR